MASFGEKPDHGRVVAVRGGQVDHAFRMLRRMLEKCGVLTQAKLNRRHTKPATQRKLDKLAALSRTIKMEKDRRREMYLSSNLMQQKVGRKGKKKVVKNKFSERRSAG